MSDNIWRRYAAELEDQLAAERAARQQLAAAAETAVAQDDWHNTVPISLVAWEMLNDALAVTAALDKKEKSWDNATPLEVLEARMQSLEEGLQQLKDCVKWALEQTAQKEGSPVRPEDVLDEEWSK